MKKINYLFLLIALFVSANVFVSCSSDNEVIATQGAGADVNAFLKSFYGQEVRFGKSVNVPVAGNSAFSRSASGGGYTVTEVFVGAETVARAYDVTDRTTKAALFFVDIDRTSYVARVVDPNTAQTTTLTNINRSPNYLSSHGLDLITVITNPGFTNPPQNQVNDWEYTYGAPYNYNGQCYKAVYRQYKILGIAFTSVEPVLNENGGAMSIPCGETYTGKKK